MVPVVDPRTRASVAELFSGVPVWRAFIRSAATTAFGHLVADGTPSPRVAVLFYGGNVVYAGDAQCEYARGIVRAFEVQPAILGYSPAWNRLIEQTYGDRLSIATRYHLPFGTHDHRVVADLLGQDTNGWRQLAAEEYDRLQEDLGWEHHKYHYESKESFLRNGNCCVIRRAERIVSGASSFVDSDTDVECQVTTAEAHRRNGYAVSVSAAYIDLCYRNGKKVPWDAANQESVLLAKKLGYREAHEYVTYSLMPTR